ncbi:MAG: cytochrome c3 family protein [Acidobacteriota bacterium]
MSAWRACSWRSSRSLIAAAWVLLALACLLRANAQSSKPAATCATCHAGVARHYATAPMRHAMELAGSNPALANHPDLTITQNGYTYHVTTAKDGKTTYSVTDGKQTLTLPVNWYFGQHSQTWVLEKDGHYYESLVSYFRKGDGLGTTPGDERLTPHTITEAMGRKLPIWETRTCFDCHGSNALQDEKLTLDKLTPGLNCERCHQGAQQHMTDALANNFKTVPPHLRRMTAQETSDFCGQCHRTWDTVIRNHWRGPAFVRFQPYRLALSKCFIGNDRRISCTACHDPHQEPAHDAAFYDAKCLACHGAAKPRALRASATEAPPAMYKQCPVAKANCVTCHMPKVTLPGGHAQFTDHFIRVVHPGDPYPN